MNSLTRIVKSAAVVDDRLVPGKPGAPPEGVVGAAPVIKREYFSAGFRGDFIEQAPRPQQSYLDELNRIKVEIAQAKAELRSLTRRIAEAADGAGETAAETRCGESPGREEPEEILGAAQAQAGEILARAVAEGNTLAEKAKNEGYLQGFSEGFEEAKREYVAENGPKAQAISELLNELSDMERDMVSKNEDGLIRLTLAVAEKILGSELKTDPKLILGMLHEALDQNRREEHIRITLSPDLLPVEASAAEEVRALIERKSPAISVVVDRDMQPGGCTVETSRGITDIGISTQLSNIQGTLLGQ